MPEFVGVLLHELLGLRVESLDFWLRLFPTIPSGQRRLAEFARGRRRFYARKLLALEQSVDIGLKVGAVRRVSLENDGAGFVDKGHVRHTPKVVCLVVLALAIADPPVLDIGPLLVLDVVLDCRSGAVDGESHEAHVFAPVFSSGLEHVLVVRHGGLAGRTPRGPKVKKHHLALLVLDDALAFSGRAVDVDLRCVAEGKHLASHVHAALNVDFEVGDAALDCLQLCLALGGRSLLVHGSGSADAEAALNNVLALVEDVDVRLGVLGCLEPGVGFVDGEKLLEDGGFVGARHV